MADAFKVWAEVYQDYNKIGAGCLWPSETLVRLMKGNYIPQLNKDYENRNVIDIGFGTGNNLVFLKSLGLNLYGVEVDPVICSMAKEKLGQIGYDADLREGCNRELPFPDNFFDYLVSWNVIHYENNQMDMLEAVKEYQRVLKPGGRFFVSTTAPNNTVKKAAQQLDKNRWRLNRSDDFRKGEIFFYFASPEDIYLYVNAYFEDILIGRSTEILITEVNDFYIITGVKRKQV